MDTDSDTEPLTNRDINGMNKANLLAAAKKLLIINSSLQEKVKSNENTTSGPMMQLLNEMKTEIAEINSTMKALYDENIRLKATLEVSHNVTDLLRNQIKSLEIQQNKADQYSRRECLEISGIPESITHEDLEKKTIEIFASIGAKVVPGNIHACHRIGKKGTTIIKLVNRKDVQMILSNKKKLKDTDKTCIGFENGTKIFINESLCPYYKGIWSKAKMLLNQKLIHSFWTSNGTVKIKMLGAEYPISIFHYDFYTNTFPDFDFSVRY